MRTLIPLILASASTVFAGLDPGKAVSDYVHQVWRTESGLPHNTVTAVIQSRDGYIWMGTEEGVVRFDGVAFTTFNTDNTPLKNNVVRTIAEDRDGSLWVGTNAGLTRLRSSQDRTYTTKDGLTGDVVRILFRDREGNLWVGTEGGGVSRFRDGAFQSYGSAQGLPSGTVFAIAQDESGDLWFGAGGGLVHGNNGIFQTVTGLPNNDVRALLPEHGALWIGTNGGGVVRLERGSMATYTTRQGLRSNAVRAILRDSEGTLWVAALDSGLHRFCNGRFEVVATNEPPSARDTWALFEDREGSLWAGTIGAGVHRYSDSKVTVAAADPAGALDTVLGVFEDREGGLWLGTKTGGVYRWKDGKAKSYTAREGLSDPRVFSIAQDRDGDIWIGTRNGLNRLHRGRVKVYTTREGLPSNTIPALFTDRDQQLWIATRKGLCRWDKDRFVTYTTAEGLANDFVISLAQAADGSLWAGTAGGGVSRLRDGRFTNYGTRQGLSSGVIFDIHADSDGTLWFGTSGGGLIRWKDGRITTITAKEGLFDSTVFRILDDGQNRLWLSSNRGISVLERKQLNDFANGRIRAVRGTSFDRADGLKTQECNGGFQPAGWRRRDGKLYFPTTQGAVVVDPARIRRNAIGPPVTLEMAVINGRPVDPATSAVILPGAGNLEFHYTAPSFLAPKKIAFRYRLEGFDTEWMEAGGRRAAYYTNIPPGDYRFRVIAANEDGVWNEAGAFASFRLRPHFYRTAWFYGLCVTAILLVLFAVHQMRVRRLNTREKELSARVEERTRQLQEQIEARDLAHAQLKDAQQRMIDLSRRSGMAEVATGVLHNVGNVLNSVNVSATIVAHRVKESHVENLVTLVDMLQNHSDDLEVYLREDPKGQRLIPYLAKLGSHFQRERQLLLKELELLTRHVQHVKEIVATQQDYAKVSGMIEEVSLADLVEDAFRIVQPSLERHNLELERDFEDLPPVMTDKHRTLQILLNLLRNAKEAIKESRSSDRVIRVRIARSGDDRVRIEIRDSGIGLQREDLTRIFAHGFTTKEGGHGFGLHSGAVAAQQMGGTLWAESEGLGCGATFVLELPMDMAQARQKAA